jgi:hypothetical protein
MIIYDNGIETAAAREGRSLGIFGLFLSRGVRTSLLTLFLAGSLLSQGSVLLVGGGSEDYSDWSDEPYRWLVNHSPNKTILVLHYSDGSSWLEAFLKCT